MLETGGVFGFTRWLVPRAQLSYARLDLGSVPPRKRPAAAGIAAGGTSTAGQVRMAWTGAIVHIWTWKQGAGDGFRPSSWWPETLLHPVPSSDGARLVEAVEGFEGQVWANGVLVSSQWWARSPSDDAWSRFVRAAALGVGERPPAQSLGIVPRPWARAKGVGAVASGKGEGLAWRAIAAVIAAMFGWQFAATARVDAQLERVERQVDAARARALPLLDARERADIARLEAERFALLQSGVSDYALMAALVAALPPGSSLQGYNRDGQQVRAALLTPVSDPRDVVRAYERVPLLSGMRATPLPNGWMGLEFSLPKPYTPGADE